MAALGILSRFEGDAHIKVVNVDTEMSFDELAEACKVHSVGLHVPDQPGKTLRVRRTTETDNAPPFPREMKVKEANLHHLDSLDVYFT
jgi:toluene monooxygenase system protein B